MSLRKHLTCKTYLEALKEDGIVARLDGDSVNSIVVERDDDPIFRPVPKHYLVGEIADRLYEYEQLGYTPEELKEIIRRYENQKMVLNSAYGLCARQQGKTNLQRLIYESLYVDTDIVAAKKMYSEFLKKNGVGIMDYRRTEITNVIFNDPATIVFWADGTKTVVKATNEAFDPEKGLAMAISKKCFGNKGNYFNQIKKWTEPYVAKRVITTFAEGCSLAAKNLKKIADALNKKGEK